MKRKYEKTVVVTKKEPAIEEFMPDGQLTIFQGRDKSYPHDLNILIHPLSCELCVIQVNSMQSAKFHYASKLHDRNITKWLDKNFTEAGLDPPVVKRFIKEGPKGPEALYCESCDLKLTSLINANQHYSGRKHRLVIESISYPSGAGYYNSEGKWVRTSSKANPVNDNDGRFGIGEDFKHKRNLVEAVNKALAVSVTTPTIDNTAVDQLKEMDRADDSIQCKVCNILVTSSSQMTMHLAGTKHRKKVMQSTGIVEKPKEKKVEVEAAVNGTTILASLNEPLIDSNVDLSMYRTPTGSYYCKICNTSIIHVSALQQHLVGKKHVRKSAEEKAKK